MPRQAPEKPSDSVHVGLRITVAQNSEGRPGADCALQTPPDESTLTVQDIGLAPELSLIVPVYNRPEQLGCLLNALLTQTFPLEMLEVLVCDDGSRDDPAGVVAVAAAAGLPVTLLCQPNGGPGAARNLGLAHARGRIVAFTDSDCVPDPGWVEALVRGFQDPKVGIVGGRVSPRRSGAITGRCVNFLMSSSLGAAGARDPRGPVRMRYLPRTCNMAVRRELATAVGFPADRHGEDLAFSGRVLDQGCEVRFLPEAVVEHDERRTLIQAAVEAYFKGRARARLARRAGMLQAVHVLPSCLVVYPLIAAAVCMIWPPLLGLMMVPLCGYIALLAALAVQAALSLKEARGTLYAPVFTMALHFGYGVGYLAEWVERFRLSVGRKLMAFH